MFAVSSVRLLLLTAISCLLNWLIHLVDVFVSPWYGCCHLKRSIRKPSWLSVDDCLQLSDILPHSSFKLRETSTFFFRWLFSFFFFASLLFLPSPLLAICLFLSVQLTTLIRQADNESQWEAMHLQLRLLSASAGRVCPSRTVCLIARCTLAGQVMAGWDDARWLSHPRLLPLSCAVLSARLIDVMRSVARRLGLSSAAVSHVSVINLVAVCCRGKIPARVTRHCRRRLDR